MALVTIASETVPNWQGNTTGVTLRIYCNSSFTASDGTSVPQSIRTNWAGLGTFFESGPCTVSSGSLVIPAVTLESTTDSVDNPAATYSAVLWDSLSGQPIQTFGTYASWSLAPTPSSTTWGAIFIAEWESHGTLPSAFQVNGTPLLSASPVDFQAGSNITITNPSAGIINIAASGGGGSFNFTQVSVGPTTGPGNFRVAHGLSVVPKFVVLNSIPGTGGAVGQFWWQSPMFDGTYLYLVASDAGLAAIVTVVY